MENIYFVWVYNDCWCMFPLYGPVKNREFPIMTTEPLQNCRHANKLKSVLSIVSQTDLEQYLLKANSINRFYNHVWYGGE